MSSARRLSSLLVLAVAFAGALGLALTPAARAQDDAAGLEQMLARINQMRSAAGIGVLTRDPRLDAAAQVHSADMAANDLLDHVSPRTGAPDARVAAAGLPGVQVAENIALNADVMAAHAALVSSDAHRANLMNPALTHLGLAAARSARGVYVTQVFAILGGAAPAEAVAVAPPPPPPVVAQPPAEPAVAAAPAEASAPAPAELTAPPQVAAAVVPGARRVAGYWVSSQGRWWYYPLPADARPGQVLQPASLPPGAAPPGYSQQGAGGPLPVYASPQYAPSQYAPPQYAPRTYVAPPYVGPRVYGPPPAAYYPPVGGSPYFAPGRPVGPPPFGGWSPRRHGGGRRH
jgi:uncharacterized protein YkwD